MAAILKKKISSNPTVNLIDGKMLPKNFHFHTVFHQFVVLQLKKCNYRENVKFSTIFTISVADHGIILKNLAFSRCVQSICFCVIRKIRPC